MQDAETVYARRKKVAQTVPLIAAFVLEEQVAETVHAMHLTAKIV